MAETRIKASLNLTTNDGSIFKGDLPDSPPTNNVVYGNFRLLDASVGLTPSGVTHTGAVIPFLQVWQDLISGLYFTNFLYDGTNGQGLNGATDWAKSVALCKDVRTKDGAGGWELPTKGQLLDLNLHDIATNVPEVPGGRTWSAIGYFWSSTQFNSTFSWSVYLDSVGGAPSARDSAAKFDGVICVR